MPNISEKAYRFAGELICFSYVYFLIIPRIEMCLS